MGASRGSGTCSAWLCRDQGTSTAAKLWSGLTEQPCALLPTSGTAAGAAPAGQWHSADLLAHGPPDPKMQLTD